MVRSMSTTGCTVDALLVPCRPLSVNLRRHQASEKTVYDHYMSGFL